eukprot:Pgem_evm1s14805
MFALTLLSFTSMLTYTTAVGIGGFLAGHEQSNEYLINKGILEKALLTQLNNALYLAPYNLPISSSSDELQTELYEGQNFGYLINSINGLNNSKVTTLFVGERKSNWMKGEHNWQMKVGVEGSLGIKLE